MATISFRDVIVWDATSGKTLSTMETWEFGSTISLSFSPDGHKLVSADNGSCKIWDVSSGALVHNLLSGVQYTVVAAVFSPDGDRVLTASLGGGTAEWEVRSGHRLTTFPSGTLPPVAAYTPDGARALIGDPSRGETTLWQVRQPTGP